jgi:hypothetical protein
VGKRKPNSDERDDLPNGQMMLVSVVAATEGRELLEPADQQRERYPLTTVARNQERLQSIIDALAAHTPLAVIISEHKIGWHTLRRIRVDYASKITDSKKRLASDLRFFAQAGVESMTEAVLCGAMDPDKLFMSVGTSIDKAAMIDAEIPASLGSSDGPKAFTLDTLNARLSRRERTVDADYTDLPTGSRGGKDSPTRATATPALDQPSKPAASDAVSES